MTNKSMSEHELSDHTHRSEHSNNSNKKNLKHKNNTSLYRIESELAVSESMLNKNKNNKNASGTT